MMVMHRRDPFGHVSALERVPGSLSRQLTSRLRELLDDPPDGLLSHQGPVHDRPVGDLVRDLVPSSCPAFARLLHPIQGPPPYGDEHNRVRWAAIARLRSLQLHSTTALAELLQSDDVFVPEEAQLEPLIGELDPVTVHHLVPILARHASSPQTFFLFWAGLSEIENHNGDVIYVGNVRLVEQFFPYQRRYFLSPSYWWNESESWFIATQTDATSTYLGGSVALIREVCTSADLEAFEVSADDLVDDWTAVRDIS